jgi:hypothetical protein
MPFARCKPSALSPFRLNELDQFAGFVFRQIKQILAAKIITLTPPPEGRSRVHLEVVVRVSQKGSRACTPQAGRIRAHLEVQMQVLRGEKFERSIKTGGGRAESAAHRGFGGRYLRRPLSQILIAGNAVLPPNETTTPGLTVTPAVSAVSCLNSLILLVCAAVSAGSVAGGCR